MATVLTVSECSRREWLLSHLSQSADGTSYILDDCWSLTKNMVCKESLRDSWNTIKQSNLYSIGVPEGEEMREGERERRGG